MKKLSTTLFLIFLSIANFAQSPINKIDLWNDNSSFDGVQGQAFVLMHNRKGMRIEYNIHRKKLELWVSPLAGISNSYVDRNFSNRDDHTRIFDKITLPELDYQDFIKCDYDAFHSVLHFKNNKLHIATFFDKAAVAVWVENATYVDIKTDKQDEIIKSDNYILVTNHKERESSLNLIAVVSEGKGVFKNQELTDRGRSFYARVYLNKNQPLYIGGDEVSTNIDKQIELLSKQDLFSSLKEDSIKIQKSLSNGYIKVRKNADLQKLINVNKRVLLSMSDESGAIRAALRYIYYLIWHRDGAMINAFCAYTGWSWPLEKWTEFQLSNPTSETINNREEQYFGQLVNGKITKREEDGPFYGIWSAFTNYTQNGDKSFLTQEKISILEKNLEWWENNYYDSQRELFGRYYYCESSFWKSKDNGFDNATGNPSGENVSIYKSDTIIKAYDLYMNNIVYTSYIMMSVLETNEAKANEYLAKSKKLGEKLNKFYRNTMLPSYGDLVNTKTKTLVADAFGMDDTDYIWGMSVPFFYQNQHTQQAIVGKILEEQMKKPKGQFFAGWFSNLAAFDSEIHGQAKIKEAIEYVVPQCVRPGKCLPMPYTIAEIVDVEDCSIYHDVRPQAFSISAMMASISNLGVRRLPFGLAVRATDYLDEISNYSYQKKEIDFRFKGKGGFMKEIKLNGETLMGTYQIPENQLVEGKNIVEVFVNDKPISEKNILISSTLKLLSKVKNEYKMDAFGKNVLVFKDLSAIPKVTFQNGQKPKLIQNKSNNITYVEFEGKGKVSVSF